MINRDRWGHSYCDVRGERIDNELTAVLCPDGLAAADPGWKRREAKHTLTSTIKMIFSQHQSPKATEVKAKIKKGLNQIDRLLHSKGNNEKRQPLE